MGDGGCEGLFWGFVSSLCRAAGGLVVPRSRKEIFTLQRDSSGMRSTMRGLRVVVLGVDQTAGWEAVKELGKAS